MDRDNSIVIDTIVKRIANAIQIEESKLFLNGSSESLQLVHYETGQLYKSHVDYGTDRPNNRFITFLLYLNTPSKGGNTSFPLADVKCKDHNGYFGKNPGKGNAVFFYDLFADGNVDPLTQHYAEPPENNSEKWMSNLWV